ncbi:MAG: 30S ribosomal protein S3 [Filifactoraceae bacterium]
MGQKVSPHGLRVGVNKDWDSRWFAGKGQFAAFIKEDAVIRKFVKKKLYLSGVSKVEIERQGQKVKVNVFTAKPGMVIGKGGQGIEDIKSDIQKLAKDKQVQVNIVEVRRPERDAQLVAENIAAALERRIAFRRAMKQAMQRAMKAGAKGIKVQTAGRLGGAEMARTEGYSEGIVPLHTLRADIGYGTAEADTTYGKLGIKVWICNGEILPTRNGPKRELEDAGRDGRRKPKKKEWNNNRNDRRQGGQAGQGEKRPRRQEQN